MFFAAKLEDDEVEDWIRDVMEHAFRGFDFENSHTDVSAVAKELCIFYSMWKQNKHDAMREKMMKLPLVNLADCENHDVGISKLIYILSITGSLQTQDNSS